MASFNNQSSYESYTYSTDSNYTNADLGSMDSTNIYFHQTPSQFNPPSNTIPLENNVYTGGNTQLNPEYYGYVENENGVNYSTRNNGLTNNNTPATYHYLPQTSDQASHTSTRSNSAGMTTNATSHGYVVIIVPANINLERLLSFIRLCERD